MDVTKDLVGKLTNLIINPLLALLMAAGLLVFLWGVIEFLVGLNGYNDKKEDGKRHMLWGIIGMFVMVAAYAIMQVLGNSICAGGLYNCYK